MHTFVHLFKPSFKLNIIMLQLCLCLREMLWAVWSRWIEEGFLLFSNLISFSLIAYRDWPKIAPGAFSPVGYQVFWNYSPRKIIPRQIPKNENFGVLKISAVLDYGLVVANYTNKLNFCNNATNLNLSSFL